MTQPTRPEPPAVEKPFPVPGTDYEELPEGFRVSASGLRLLPALFLLVICGVAFALRREPPPALALFAPLLLAVLAFALVLTATVTVEVRGDRGTVRRGIGPIGWRRRFRWTDVVEVDVRHPFGSLGASSGGGVIYLLGPRTRLGFGSFLHVERQWYVLGILAYRLAKDVGRAV